MKSNVQLVLIDVNRMKTNLIETEFVNLCKAIAEHNGGQPKES